MESDRAEGVLQELDALQRLIETEEWGILVAYQKDAVEEFHRQFATTSDWHEVGILKGRIEQANNIIYLEDTVANYRKAFEEQLDAGV
jgi:hypothetical protein